MTDTKPDAEKLLHEFVDANDGDNYPFKGEEYDLELLKFAFDWLDGRGYLTPKPPEQGQVEEHDLEKLIEECREETNDHSGCIELAIRYLHRKNMIRRYSELARGEGWEVMLHILKIEEKYFLEVDARQKTFEIRKNDRGFKVNDLIELEEIGSDGVRTGRRIMARITYITDYEQKPGYVVFSFVIE